MASGKKLTVNDLAFLKPKPDDISKYEPEASISYSPFSNARSVSHRRLQSLEKQNQDLESTIESLQKEQTETAAELEQKIAKQEKAIAAQEKEIAELKKRPAAAPVGAESENGDGTPIVAVKKKKKDLIQLEEVVLGDDAKPGEEIFSKTLDA